MEQKRHNIIISEAQRDALFGEGVNWNTNADGTVDFSINQDRTDKANKSELSVDTRVFGNKDQILNGDGTMRKNSKTLSSFNNSRRANIEFYKKVIEYVRNGRQGKLEKVDGMDSNTYTSVAKWFEENYSDNRIIDAATKAIHRIEGDSDAIFRTYDRVSQSNDGDKTARYTTGTVPGTNVKYVALFTMSDFNFSDAVKHGKLRQNGNTDQLLGIDKSQRQKDSAGNNVELGLTYDGNVTPNVAQNFSLNGVQQGHQKQQYGLNGQGGYTSVSQFIDKSVNYAAYVLRKENFHPDFIVAAPSSSDFNKYYCTNLSRKLGVEYIDKFYKRNLINVRFDGNKDPEEMMSKGFTPKDIAEFESQVRNIAIHEIEYFISEPVRRFVSDYWHLLNNIPVKKSSRTKADMSIVVDCTASYAFNVILKYIGNDGLSTNLLQNFIQKQNKLQRGKYDSRYVHQFVSNVVKSRIGQRAFNKVMGEMQQIMQQYSQQLKEVGYKLSFTTKRFKITSFKKQFRPFLHNVYVIADEHMSNGSIQSRYQNAKFLIFDEDINSGATLKLAIDTLSENLPNATAGQMMCLVNGYSASGF